MPVTPNKSIAYPDSTYPVSPLENLFSVTATSVDTALTTLQQISRTQVANQAARDALFPSPVSGNSVYRIDLGYDEEYSGTGWGPLAPQMKYNYRAAATDASGRIIVIHNLNGTPSMIQITGGRTGSLLGYRVYSVDQSSITSTQFTVYISRSDTGAAYASLPADFFWLAII